MNCLCLDLIDALFLCSVSERYPVRLCLISPGRTRTSDHFLYIDSNRDLDPEQSREDQKRLVLCEVIVGAETGMGPGDEHHADPLAQFEVGHLRLDRRDARVPRHGLPRREKSLSGQSSILPILQLIQLAGQAPYLCIFDALCARYNLCGGGGKNGKMLR